jgi:ribosomal protein L11
MVTSKRFRRVVLSAYTIFFALSLFGCIVAAVPLIINATKGSSTSTATVLINRDAATVYADAVKAVKQRGYTQVTKQDDTRYFLEGNRKGKNATLQVAAVASDQSRIIITIENDKDAKDINEAVEALMQTCRQLGVQCKEQKS